MLDKVRDQIYSDFPDIGKYNLFLAISGGKDSMVLSYLLRQLDLEHTLLHCNFQLRGKEANEDEQFLLTYAKTYDLAIEVQRFDTYEFAKEKGLSIQQAARELRYNWFETFNKKDETLILTAHHLDDSIETFFINLLRGTGVRGIKGIPRFNNPFYRPLLNFSSDDIFKYIDQNEVDYREDSTNSETKYLRNRLRHSLVPLLIEIEPEFKTKMMAFFSEMEDINALIDKISIANLPHLFADENKISIERLKDLDPLLIQFSLSNYGIKRSNLRNLLNLVQCNVGAIFRSTTHEFLRDRDFIFVSELDSKQINLSESVSDFPTSVELNQVILQLDVVSVNQLNKTNEPIQIDYDKVELPILIRNWKHGDKITPFGMNGSKLISDILIDKKIPKHRKSEVIVIEDATKKIIGIVDLMINEYYKADKFTKKLLQISSNC